MTFNATRYTLIFVIKDFNCEETRKIYVCQHSHKLPPGIQQIALRKLRMLNNAVMLVDMRVPPANHLEKLKGARVGQYSIRINSQWRICFEWQDGNSFNVEIVDYH